MTEGRAALIHARLLQRAKARGKDFNLILTRYVLERPAAFQERCKPLTDPECLTCSESQSTLAVRPTPPIPPTRFYAGSVSVAAARR